MEINKVIDTYNAIDAPVPYEKLQKARNALKNTIAYQSYNSVLNGNYLSGKLNGKWSYKILTSSKSPLIYSIANFKDNKIVGDFSYAQKNATIIGQFSDIGLITGKWIIKWTSAKNVEYENIREYENGIFKNMIERNLITGDIIRNNKENLYDDYQPSIPYREGYGIVLMIAAIEFWMQPKDGNLGAGYIDEATISNRNYSYKFDRGITKPINPLKYKPNPSVEKENFEQKEE